MLNAILVLVLFQLNVLIAMALYIYNQLLVFLLANQEHMEIPVLTLALLVMLLV